MNPLAMEFTSVQMLVAAIVAFLLLVSLAVWFYRSAAEDETKPSATNPAPATKPAAAAPRPFIPVVRPPSRNVARPVSSASSPPPLAPPIAPPVVAAAARGDPIIAAKSPPPSMELYVAVEDGISGQQALVVKTRGHFPVVEGRRLVFGLDFILVADLAAKVLRRERQERRHVELKFRVPRDPEASAQVWLDLLTIPLEQLSLPTAGTHLLRVDCSSLLTDIAVPEGGALPSDAMLCTASAEVSVIQSCMGYRELDGWISSREAALFILAGCASPTSPDRDSHREIILNWISSECAKLVLSSEERKAHVGSLLARFGSCQIGVRPSAVGCEALSVTMPSSDPLRDSMGAVFDALARATVESCDPLDRIEHACHWLKLPTPAVCAQSRRRINLRNSPDKPPVAAVPTRPPPPPQVPVKPAPPPVAKVPFVPFAVSLKLVGTEESAKGLRVYVSGDLPAYVATDVQVSVSVLDKDDDAKRAFMVLPDDIDVVGQVLLPKTVFPGSQYDSRAPRQVAEILFADCAYPRSGDRNLRVVCAAYSVGQAGALTHLCSAEASGAVKIPGAGYVLQQKRRRVQRGLMLQLALAAILFSGPVSTSQKSIVKEWIEAEAAKINDKEEVRLTVNYLTKVLLKASTVTHAELIALAIDLAGRRRPQLSAEAVKLTERLIAAKAGSESVIAPYLAKIRQELGLPAGKGLASQFAPVRPAKPKQPRAKPVGATTAAANPAVRRALGLNRKLGRTVADWATMGTDAKVAHLRQQLLLRSSQMSSKQGLSDRHELQQEINDHAELVVLIRNGKA